MKELSIEEKAKAYDEAIAHAKMLLKIIGNATLGNLVLKNEFKNMFPELAESEDERISREITEFLVAFNNGGYERPNENTIDSWLSWLEKQGEKGINGKNREIPFSEQKPAWSEEDEKYLIYNIEQDYRDKLNNNPPESLRPYYNKVISWLKSRIPQKQELSKEDEQFLTVCKNALAKYQVSDKWDAGIISRWLENRLKSLSPKKQWKPSKEQIKALKWALQNIPYNIHKEEISGLLDQIKEL